MRLPPVYCRWILAHRYLVVGCAVAITAVFAVKLAQTPFAADPLRAFVEDESVLRAHAARNQKFGGDDGEMILVATDELNQLFTRESFDAIRSATTAIEKLAQVESVASLAQVRRKGVRQRLSTREIAARGVARSALLEGRMPDGNPPSTLYWPTESAQKDRVNFDRLRSDLMSDEAIIGTLLASNGHSQAMLIELKASDDLGIARHREVERRLREILVEQGLGRGGIFIVGLPINNLAMTEAMQHALLTLLPLGVLGLGGLLFLIFRQIAVALLALLLGGVAIVWGLGTAAFVYGELSLLVAGAPLVILAVSTTDLVHITSAYQQALGAGRSQRDTICQVFADVGGACLLTSLTTFVGFAALLYVASPTVRHFGLTSAVGAASALLMVLLISPIIFDCLPPLAALRNRRSRWLDRWLDQVVNRCAAISTQYPRLAIGGGLLCCIPALFALYGKQIEADLPSRFASSHPLQQSLRMLDTQFSGTASFDIYLSAAPEVLLDPKLIAEIALWESKLAQLESVTRVTSITSLYRAVDTAVWYRTDSGLPPSRAAAESSIAWARRMEPISVRRLICDKNDELRVRVATSATGFRQVARLAGQAEDLARQTLSSEITVEAGGNYPLIGRVIGRIVDSQIRGLGFCIASLGGIMVLGFRSVRVGVLSQIPNVIPVILMMGIVAYTQPHIDSDMLGLPMIALGLVVDDTVHFLHRYRESLNQDIGTDEALKTAFHETGRAIIVSTIVLSGGLLPLALSSTLSLRMLGTYLVVGLVAAVIADLIVLPAMIQLGWMRDPESRLKCLLQAGHSFSLGDNVRSRLTGTLDN